MPKLPLISGAKALKAFARLGFVKMRQRGSHVVLRRGALRQAKVTDEQFVESLR